MGIYDSLGRKGHNLDFDINFIGEKISNYNSIIKFNMHHTINTSINNYDKDEIN